MCESATHRDARRRGTGDDPARDRAVPAGPDDMETCYAVRHRVFVVGQGVPVELERDDEDARAVHWLVRRGGRVVGTARARVVDGDAKAERVAVLEEARGTGAGRALMEAIEAWAAAQGLRAVVLHAQIDAIPFYHAIGYTPVGDVFVEAGIPHRSMVKPRRVAADA